MCLVSHAHSHVDSTMAILFDAACASHAETTPPSQHGIDGTGGSLAYLEWTCQHASPVCMQVLFAKRAKLHSAMPSWPCPWQLRLSRHSCTQADFIRGQTGHTREYPRIAPMRQLCCLCGRLAPLHRGHGHTNTEHKIGKSAKRQRQQQRLQIEHDGTQGSDQEEDM